MMRTINSIVLINNHAMILSMLNNNKSAGRDKNHKQSSLFHAQ